MTALTYKTIDKWDNLADKILGGRREVRGERKTEARGV